MDWPVVISLMALLASIPLLSYEFRSFTGSLEAYRKGEELLVADLTPEQRKQYEAFGYFDVVGSVSGKRYRIYHGTHRNVVEVVGGRRGPGRCFTPRGDLVAGDCMLAQKVAIENYEEEVLRTALRF